MADVGRASGVSAQTVSRYYTGGYVSPATKASIEQAVSELGYQHNKLPSILRAQHTDAIGYLSMGPLNFGNSGILTGISRAARAEGQTLLTTQLDLDPESTGAHGEFTRALESFISVRVDGIVVGTPYVGLEKLLEDVGRSVPIVSLSEVTYEGIETIHADSYGAARLAMAHLVELGHRRILHLAGPGNRNESGERLRGYRDGLTAAGLDELPMIRCVEWDAVSGAAAAAEADPSTFTAVFSANDEIALGFMSAMRERGLVAPDDYSIAGVDDMPEARFFAPPLTSSRLDFETLGETALRRILGIIHDIEQEPREVIPAVLSPRASTRRLTEDEMSTILRTGAVTRRREQGSATPWPTPAD